MKNLIRFSAILFLLLGLESCSSSYDNPKSNQTTTTFNAILDAASEVPSNNSTNAGTATLTFNNTTKIFSISVTHTIASPTAGHIHKGAVGISGDPVFPFPSASSPITYMSGVLTTTQEADLKANLYYVNIHCTAFSNGEIRGQLIKGTTTGGGSGGDGGSGDGGGY